MVLEPLRAAVEPKSLSKTTPSLLVVPESSNGVVTKALVDTRRDTLVTDNVTLGSSDAGGITLVSDGLYIANRDHMNVLATPGQSANQLIGMDLGSVVFVNYCDSLIPVETESEWAVMNGLPTVSVARGTEEY